MSLCYFTWHLLDSNLNQNNEKIEVTFKKKVSGISWEIRSGHTEPILYPGTYCIELSVAKLWPGLGPSSLPQYPWHWRQVSAFILFLLLLSLTRGKCFHACLCQKRENRSYTGRLRQRQRGVYTVLRQRQRGEGGREEGEGEYFFDKVQNSSIIFISK